MKMIQVVPDVFLEAKIELPTALVDVVSDYIIEHVTSGMVQEQEDGSETTTLIFYVPSDQTPFEPEMRKYLAALMSLSFEDVPAIVIKRVENTEWLAKYRESIQEYRIGEDLIVRPPWIEPTADKYQLVIEPRMAFGTGSHATTRSCLKLIREHFQSGMRFLDMGCGSGVLSILADQMGAAEIKAVDYDLAAVANCRENFEVNDIKAPHEVITGSIDKCLHDEPYDLLCANIIRSTILSMLELLLKLTKPDGRLILSGLLEKDEQAITAALRKQGQDRFEIVPDEEWLTYSIHKR